MLCPYKTHPDYKKVVAKYGDEMAFRYFMAKLYTVEQIENFNKKRLMDEEEDLTPQQEPSTELKRTLPNLTGSTSDKINTLFNEGVFVEKNGRKFFKQNQTRLGVIVNVNGVEIPFYQSQGQTGGKTTNWTPFYGNTGSWLIKSSIDKINNGLGIKAIQDMMVYLDKNIPEYLSSSDYFTEEQRQTLNSEITSNSLGKLQEQGNDKVFPEVALSKKEVGETLSNLNVIKYDINTAPTESSESYEFVRRIENLLSANLKQESISQQQEPSIKEGVPELFESNPELANAVYETLGFEIPTTKLQGRKAIDGRLVNFDVIEELAFAERSNIPSSILIKKLLNGGYLPKINETDIVLGGLEYGIWRPNLKKIEAQGGNKSTLAKKIGHELLHSVTDNIIYSYQNLKGVIDFNNKYYKDFIKEGYIKPVNLTNSQVEALDNLVKIRNKVVAYVEQNKDKIQKQDRGFGTYDYFIRTNYTKSETDLHEFISEVFTNPELINILKEIPTEGKKSNLFKDFVDAISKILGFTNTSILEDIIAYSEEAFFAQTQITPQQKQQAQQQYSQYLQQNPNGSVEQFKSWVEEFNRKTNIQGAYDFSASSNSGKWNSANNQLHTKVQDNKRAFLLYKVLIGNMETFKEIVDYINQRVSIEVPYTDAMKRADETMTAEERKSAIDSYNNSVNSKIEDKAQVEKDILSENNLQDETEYTPQELIEKYPLTGVQKVIWNLIKDIVNKLGIKVKFSSSRITEGFDGSFDPQNGEILIRPSTLKNGRFGEVLVHEVVHALTTKIISRVNSGVTTGLTQKQINAVKGLMKLFEAVEADNNLEDKYPVKDVFEFIAHLTNEEFVKELESKDKNFLQKVVDFILDILGINNANELSKKYLLDIISDGVFLQENGITVLPSDYGSNIQGSLSDFITQKSQERLNQTTKIKKGVPELFESNPELASIGTQQLYSQYLDTIFPDSKVKDIVYHGSDKPLNVTTKLRRNQRNFSGEFQIEDGIFFSRVKQGEAFSAAEYGKVHTPTILNVKNPELGTYYNTKIGKRVKNSDSILGTHIGLKKSDTIEESLKSFGENYETTDKNKWSNIIVVFEPEQIHILGSKQDIEGFNEFTKDTESSSPALPTEVAEDKSRFKQINTGVNKNKPNNPNNDLPLDGFKENERGLFEVFEDNKDLLMSEGISLELLNHLKTKNKYSIQDIESWINNCLKGKSTRDKGNLSSKRPPQAKKGMKPSKFTKGGTWKIIEDLKGFPTHEQGGVDLYIGKDGVNLTKNKSEFKAEYGLVIPKSN